MNNMMDKILKQDSQNNEILKSVLNDYDLTKLYDKLHHIKIGFIYQRNHFHGLHHSQKVILFAYLLGLHERLNDVDLEILLDAAIYHDIGREDDNEDTFHGYSGSLKIYQAVKDNPIYQDENNKKMLEAIVDMHSAYDRNLENIFYNHELPEEFFERYKKLSGLLKDADALDRLRFGKKSPASLKTQFLRFEYALKLVPFAAEVNHLYYQYICEINDKKFEAEREKEYNPCFHSIGFDFFKINSIMENGILCRAAMKEKNMDIPRNFTGGNLENWISVVDTGKIESGRSAFLEFTNQGVGFFCYADKLYAPEKSMAIALETGLPYDKSGYSDEKYAYRQIEKDRLIFLVIPKQYIYEDIRNLKYIYHTLNSQMILDRIKYYIAKTEFSASNPLVNELLNNTAEYCHKIDIYQSQSEFIITPVDDKLFSILNNALEKINHTLQMMIYEYYARILGCMPGENIRVIEVVQYQLSLLKQPCPILNMEEEAIFQINDAFAIEKIGKRK